MPAVESESRIVTLLSVGTAVRIRVGMFKCWRCDRQCHCTPLSLGYFPSTLDRAVDLTKGSAKSSPLWFGLDFLQNLATLQVRVARHSVKICVASSC